MTVGETLKGRYPRRGAAEDQLSILGREEEPEDEETKQEAAAPGSPAAVESTACDSKKVAIAFLPDKYEPLGWTGNPQAQAGESKNKKRRRKLRKYGKNVGKALQKGCRYLVLGLQGLANAYSSPLGVAVSVAGMFR